ncbi:hypothetical protein L6452_12364 [Arctium lappa]|uniref:Uncharacterized protein n=1 Tax=Arctium lappa TaxID=4217 RepID=A0ACB9DR59_ARCLA|nr:hypothetical protein L6452_12364 [Arctium lappa]
MLLRLLLYQKQKEAPKGRSKKEGEPSDWNVTENVGRWKTSDGMRTLERRRRENDPFYGIDGEGDRNTCGDEDVEMMEKMSIGNFDPEPDSGSSSMPDAIFQHNTTKLLPPQPQQS